MLLHGACQSIGIGRGNLQEIVTLAGRRRITCAKHARGNVSQQFGQQLQTEVHNLGAFLGHDRALHGNK